MEIKNVGQLRKIIENLPDDFEIEMRVRRKLTDEELKNCRYPYPYDTEYLTLEFDDKIDDIAKDWQLPRHELVKKVLNELKKE